MNIRSIKEKERRKRKMNKDQFISYIMGLIKSASCPGGISDEEVREEINKKFGELKVYFITMGEKDLNNFVCVGFTFDLELAKREVLQDHMYEFLYKYAIIEECIEGYCPRSRREWWYKATYLNSDPGKKNYDIKEIEKPKELKQIYGFWM